MNAFELMKAMIEAGAAGVHFEDQLASEKKCGHMEGKVLQAISGGSAFTTALSGSTEEQQFFISAQQVKRGTMTSIATAEIEVTGRMDSGFEYAEFLTLPAYDSLE